MEYTAVFLLFVMIVAAAFRTLASGKGTGELVFLCLLVAFMCFEPVGEEKIALSSIFLACVGVVRMAVKRDVAAVLCAATVAVCSASLTEGAYYGEFADYGGFLCAAALCAIACGRETAAFALAVGFVSGNAYSLFADSALATRTDLFSQKIVFAAIVCHVAACFFTALQRALQGVDGRTLRTEKSFDAGILRFTGTDVF